MSMSLHRTTGEKQGQRQGGQEAIAAVSGMTQQQCQPHTQPVSTATSAATATTPRSIQSSINHGTSSYSEYASSVSNTVTPATHTSMPTCTTTTAATRLLEILVQLRDANGRGLLHEITHDHSVLKHAQVLLQRAAFVSLPSSSATTTQSTTTNTTIILEQLICQSDYESGYSPLHYAIFNASLPAILLLVRFINDRLIQRPMHLLASATTTTAPPTTLTTASSISSSKVFTKMMAHKDHEGLTPFQLLAQLQVKSLTKIRMSLLRQQQLQLRPLQTSSYSYSSSLDPLNHFQYDLDWEFIPQLSMFVPFDQRVPQRRFACEVMTFGAAHHPALGVSDTTKQSYYTNCPQRIVEFSPCSFYSHHQVMKQDGVEAEPNADGTTSRAGGQQQQHATNTATQVAAATHHTLILTEQGQVYACGLGKGGRLGTGREQSTPTPIRITGILLKQLVIHVAAADNHSICVTQNGSVFSWGSNRFGQLGISTPSSSSSLSPSTTNNNNNTANRLLPTKVMDLIKHRCVAVAAGEKHSVALTQNGEVYTWGDNSAGQLGQRRCTNNSQHQRKGTTNTNIERVDALWNDGERVAIQIQASDKSTLVLVRPSAAARQRCWNNSVYSWGHGNPNPMKVAFDTSSGSSSGTNPKVNTTGSSNHHHFVNPIAIACGRHHNVAISRGGKVYTFGLNSETLASKRSSSLVIASPVTGMYPEHGGGHVVAVSASNHHTAVITAQGHLFTWGYTTDKDIMGHEGLRWQPSPKRVAGVHRAVGVAVAKEHTVLLIGTSFPNIPPLSHSQQPKLETLAARRVCDHVDMFNVIPIAIMAERTHCTLLQYYCREFIRENLDGVLTFGRKSELDIYLNEMLADCRDSPQEHRDASIHPLVLETIMMSHSQSDWLSRCVSTLHNLPISTLVKYQKGSKKGYRRRRASSFNERNGKHPEDDESPEHLQTGHEGCSEKCLSLTANLSALVTEEQLRNRYESLSREIRGIKKRLAQTEKLSSKETVTAAEREKLFRKPLLEADLAQLVPALERIEKHMSQRNMVLARKTDNTNSLHDETIKKTTDVPQCELKEDSQFKCDVCAVSCPDATHLELHKNGRKHRNRIKQVKADATVKTAMTIFEDKKQQQQAAAVLTDSRSVVTTGKGRDSDFAWSVNASVQPRYQLPSPSVPPGPMVHVNQVIQVVHRSVSPGHASSGRSCVVNQKASPSWPSPLAPTAKAKSLRSILKEEEEQQKQSIMGTVTPKALKPSLQLPRPQNATCTWSSPRTPSKVSSSPKPPRQTPHPQNSTRSWSSPVVSVVKDVTPCKLSSSSTMTNHKSLSKLSTQTPRPPNQPCSWPSPVVSVTKDVTPSKPLSSSSNGKKQTLLDFWNDTEKPVKVSASVAAPWAPKPKTNVVPKAAAASSTPPPAQSLLEIQKQEEEFSKRQSKHVAKEAKWYIGAVDRAGSFASIQELDVLEMHMRMEEEKEIQRQIKSDEKMATKLQQQRQSAGFRKKVNTRMNKLHNHRRLVPKTVVINNGCNSSNV